MEVRIRYDGRNAQGGYLFRAYLYPLQSKIACRTEIVDDHTQIGNQFPLAVGRIVRSAWMNEVFTTHKRVKIRCLNF